MICYYILYPFIGLIVLYMTVYLSVKNNIDIADSEENEKIMCVIAFLFWPIAIFAIIIVSIKALATTKAKRDMGK